MKNEVLVVVDMQNDFIDGALGTKEAASIVPAVEKKIKEFEGHLFFTKDTHYENYMETQEGKKLPVPHCIKGTKGWDINPQIAKFITDDKYVIEKPTFGSEKLGNILKKMNEEAAISKIFIIGLCTDICVISNAMIIKACLPEVEIAVDSKCCAGVTPESHLNALEAMKMCQIEIN